VRAVILTVGFRAEPRRMPCDTTQLRTTVGHDMTLMIDPRDYDAVIFRLDSAGADLPVVLLDFDGTLCDIVDEPNSASAGRVERQNWRSVLRLHLRPIGPGRRRRRVRAGGME
jgi:hypothetical protein